MSNNIKTGDIVRFAVVIESCDENTRFVVIDDYGTNCNRCKVQLICNLPIPPTYVYFKEDLIEEHMLCTNKMCWKVSTRQ